MMDERRHVMENSICKIVYFDEDSVTDYVQIIAGGELEKTTQLLKETDKTQIRMFRFLAKPE